MMQMVIILEKNINKGVFLNIDKIESIYLNYSDAFHSNLNVLKKY
jgi:hypothetical protein